VRLHQLNWNLGKRHRTFITEIQETKNTAAANESVSEGDLSETRTLIAGLEANQGGLSAAMSLATQAQIDALKVNESIFAIDYGLNVDIQTLIHNTLNIAQNIDAEFETLQQNADTTDFKQATNNVLIYSARVHSTIASYHNQLKVLYDFAASEQADKETNITDIVSVDSDYLQEYEKQHQVRADNFVIDDGSESVTPELFGLAKAALRQKRLIDRHADISNKRRRLNVALFAPLQQLNEASRDKYSSMSEAQSQHFANNKMLGRSDRERFKQLERLYRDRLAVLEVTDTQDNDIFANDSERKALYQTLADVNKELGIMYTAMSDEA